MQKFASLFLVLGLFLWSVGPVAAEGSSASVSGPTGPDSTNTATVNDSDSLSINIANSATTSYDFDLNLNTGNNTVSGNTTAGNLVSGNINADINLDTEINQDGLSGLCDGCFGVGGAGTASVTGPTGPGSTNSATVNSEDDVSVNVANRAETSYKFKLAANTGGNTCAHNTTVGDCRSGNISVNIDISDEINQGGVGGNGQDGDGEEDGDGVTPGPIARNGVRGVSAGPTVAGVGGAALFAAGSSLLYLFLLILAANGWYFLRRRFPFAIHLPSKGKAGNKS